MATNQSGIAIVIKAFLPSGKTLDEQFAALSIVKQAHESGDYAALLKAAHDVEVKTEAKTRRVEEHQPPATIYGGEDDPDFADLPDAPEAAPEAAEPIQFKSNRSK